MRVAFTLVPALCVGALSIWLASGSAEALAPSPETGAEIAARWCADCHVVSRTGAGLDRAPGFVELSGTKTHEDILKALSGPHSQPVKGFKLSAREVADVAAYIDSLKTEPPAEETPPEGETGAGQ